MAFRSAGFTPGNVNSHGSLRLEAIVTAAQLTDNGISVFTACRRSPGALTLEFANQNASSRFGVGVDRVKPETILSQDHNRELMEILVQRARDGNTDPFQIEVTRPDRSRYWVNISCAALGPDAHGCMRMVVVTSDITNYRDTERMRDLLASCIEEEPDAVAIVRLNEENVLYPNYVYANNGFFEMCGYTQADLSAGIYPVMLGPRSDRHKIAECAMRVLDGEPVATEVVLYRKDGTAYWAEVRAHLLESPGRHCVLIIRDISERREREETLNLLSRAVEEASDFVLVTDSTPPSSGGPFIVYANRAFCEATGFAEHELVGQPKTFIYSERNDPRLIRAIDENIEQGSPNYREALFRRKDGSDLWIEFVAKPFARESQGDTHRLSIGRDITLRKRSLNQVTLMLGAIETSQDRVVLYEAAPDGHLVVAYENAAAESAGKSRLLDMWNRSTTVAATLRERLQAGVEIRHIFADHTPEGTPSIVEFSARAVRGMHGGIEAVLTTERVLADVAQGGAGVGFRSRMVSITAALPALAQVATPEDRFLVLEAILAQSFGAKIAPAEARRNGDGLRIDPVAKNAHFRFAGTDFVVSWPETLENTSLTALRFCIEAALEEY